MEGREFREENFVASLNTSVRTLFESYIPPKELVQKIIDMGGRGCVITDNGVLSSIEDYRPYFAEAGLRLVPGVKLNVRIEDNVYTVILIARNDNGYKGISKTVTESNKPENIIEETPTVSEDDMFRILEPYSDDIYCLTSDIKGVMTSILLKNNNINKEIYNIKLEKTQYSTCEKKYKAKEKEYKDKKAEYDALLKKRDEISAIADKKYIQREKAVVKMEEKGDPDAEKARKQLEDEKTATEEAKAQIGDIKKEIRDINKELKVIEKEKESLNEGFENFNKLQKKIEEKQKFLIPEEKIIKETEEKLIKYEKYFGAHFYVELQNHGMDEEKAIYPTLANLAKKNKIPVVATNSVHMLNNSDKERLKRRIIRSKNNDREKMLLPEEIGDKEMYFKNNKSLADALSKILPEDIVQQAIDNISRIFDDCNVTFKTSKHYPVYDKNGDANSILEDHVAKGIKKRFPGGMDIEHQRRVEYELKIIKDMGYADYHLIVEDYLTYGRLLGYLKEEEIDDAPLTIEELRQYIAEKEYKNSRLTIGPGRGSAGGSLVCYSLGITSIDPIKYGLIFERFLNPERISMPDIDSDFASRIRDKVVDYVRHKYGEKAVCGIMTTNSQAPRGVLRLAAKYYGLEYKGKEMTELGDRLSKDVPMEAKIQFSTQVEGKTLKEYLKDKYKDNKDALTIIDWAEELEGIFTSYGAHAAGVVISDNEDISDYLPLRYNSTKNMYTTQCNMNQVEENGLLKFDFLGLKTLDVISDTLSLIEKEHNKIIDPLSLDLDDGNVYKKILQTGKTRSVFQFESTGMMSMLQRFKPNTFEDMILLVAMYRPGPLQYMDEVINVKNGEKEMEFMTPRLEPILNKTYGAIVYQEQVMQICQSLAGFTLAHADQVRKYMSKKNQDKLAHEREAFIDGCYKNGIDKIVANDLFDQMMDFASYAFNKSHAVVYALIAYITAWLKCYYPAEFFTAALNWTEKDTKIAALIYDAKEFGIKILSPDINMSGINFTIENDGIRFGISSIKGVKSAGENIINERGKGIFKDFKDFYVRCRPDSRVIENLINSGACDEWNNNRRSLKLMAESLKKPTDTLQKDASFIRSAEALLPVIETLKTDEEVIEYQKKNELKAEISSVTTANKLQKRIDTKKKEYANTKETIKMLAFQNVEEDKDEKMKLEKQFLGLYLTAHPLDYYPSAEEVGATVISKVNKDTTRICGVISNLVIKERRTDKAKIAFFDLEDRSSSIETCVFAQKYRENESLIKEGNVVILEGTSKIDVYENTDGNIDERKQFFVNKVKTSVQKKCPFILECSSIATFHIDIEKDFRKLYEDKDGHELYIYDRKMNEIRRMTYKVSDKTKSIPNCLELNV